MWDLRHFLAIAPEGQLSRALTQRDLDLVSSEVTKQCDVIDGLSDGIVAAFGQCRFDPGALRGKLADNKIDALVAVMNGAHDADENPVYTGWPWDPGISAQGWRAWKLGTEDRPAMHQTLSLPSTGQLFLTPPRSLSENPDYAQLAHDVAPFAQRGGKMVIFQGAADPIFSATDIARWQTEVSANTGDDVSRLFVVPGMTHCGGGPAFEDFDPLTILEQWRATGEAPLDMPAKAPSMPGREMPICAFPAYAHYNGGDETAAESFSCVTP